ncbi:DUF2141 domain-containing protein [Christiangramia aquimixticola]|uniref:DUF2141 domain-containing protein n=1 Tax=Christiangramia aquimixticola TaxID=1697558 RepID=UPI003AA9D910
MKTILFLLAILATNLVNAQDTESGNIEVKVPNVSSSTGEVLFALYTEDNFMQAPVASLKAEIIEGEASANFKNLKEGNYAILVMHDVNMNMQMDFDIDGLPLEDYGSSNNVYEMGPPTWGNSNFKFTGKNTKMEIRF